MLERLVPLGESRIPFLWVDRSGYDEFEERARASDIVEYVQALARVNGSVLYYVEQYPEHGMPHQTQIQARQPLTNAGRVLRR